MTLYDTACQKCCSLLKNIVVYFQAVDCYKKGLELLSSKQRDDVVDSLKMSVSWDLSSVYFTMATYLQDFAPVSSYAQQQVLSSFQPTFFRFLLTRVLQVVFL